MMKDWPMMSESMLASGEDELFTLRRSEMAIGTDRLRTGCFANGRNCDDAPSYSGSSSLDHSSLLSCQVFGFKVAEGTFASLKDISKDMSRVPARAWKS